MNPYSGLSFFEFFFTFGKRLLMLFQGDHGFFELAPDEIQLFALMGIACSAALIGSFLVLRKMTMLANALSHTILLGIVIAFLLFRLFSNQELLEALGIGMLMVASLLASLLTVFFIELLTRMRVQEDASIGLVFTTLFAIGVLLVTLFSRNTHVGTELVMGNVDALTQEDLTFIFSALGINLVLFLLFFKEFALTTFDGQLASALGFSRKGFHYLLMILTSLTAVSAFRAVGFLMVLAYFVAAPLTARLYTHRLSTMLVIASLIGALNGFCAVAFSRHLLSVYDVALSTGSLCVVFLGLSYFLSVFFAPKRGLLFVLLNRKKAALSEVSEEFTKVETLDA